MEKSKTQFDVCIIGSGPGGYVCAIRAAQLGLKVAIIEKKDLGGVCLNVGCIPSKALITAAHFYHKALHDASKMGIEFSSVKLNMKKLKTWKDSVCDKMSKGVKGLLAGNGIEVIQGEAFFKTDRELVVRLNQSAQSAQQQKSTKQSITHQELLLTAKKFVIATGSRPINIPGFSIDEKQILSSTGALNLEVLPKQMVIIGAGYIGLEIAFYLNRLGVKITLLEAGSDILSGVVDKDIARVLLRSIKKEGVDIHLNTKAKGYTKKASRLELSFENQGKIKTTLTDKILLTVGRKPFVSEDVQALGLELSDLGGVAVDAQCRTSIPHIFAIGDVARAPLLAHKASYEGLLVAEVMGGKNRVYDPKTVPAVIFTSPEIASVGLTEAEALAQGYEIIKSTFPFTANGRAVSLMETDGLVKMIAEKSTRNILGIHIIGPEASQLISEGALALEMGACLEDIAATIHPHPTLSETFMEAAEATLGHAVHILQK